MNRDLYPMPYRVMTAFEALSEITARVQFDPGYFLTPWVVRIADGRAPGRQTLDGTLGVGVSPEGAARELAAGIRRDFEGGY